MEKIKLAISPCPNDTYIFGPWINQLISNKEEAILPVEAIYLDIQELNNQSQSYAFDVIKVSAAKAVSLLDQYQILTCGAALGENVGPLLISNRLLKDEEMNSLRIAHPGKDTTAFQLLQFAYPRLTNCQQVVFSEIEDGILSNSFDAGVIIHENRFTYQNKGLQLVKDLGMYWQQKTNSPIPLGLIMVRRNLPKELKKKIHHQILCSLEYSKQYLEQIYPFIKQHAQEMEEKVIMAHIELYVNEYSWNLGDLGKDACKTFFGHMQRSYQYAPTDFFD